jgi:hypothetical protein
MGAMFILLALAIGLIPVLLIWEWMKWLRRRRALPPYIRGLRRAQAGAFLLMLCAYAATWFPEFLRQSLGDLIYAFLRTPSDPPVALVVFAGFVVWGLAQFILGVMGARRGGDRDLMSAICSLFVAGLCFYLMEWNWYLPPARPEAPLGNIAIKSLYLGMIAAALVRAWLSLPGAGSALRVVARHIEQRAVVWRSARSS